MAKQLECCLILLSIISVICLRAPKGVKVSFLEPSGVYVEWDEVPLEELRNIEGFKIKLWAIKEDTTRNYKLLNGEQYPGLERNDHSKEPFNERISDSNISEITLESPGNIARIKYLSFNKLYEVRVIPYQGDEVGPMSAPRRFKLVRNDNFVMLAERGSDWCAATIITNKTDEPYVHKTVF